VEGPLRLARSARHGDHARLDGDDGQALRAELPASFGANKPKLYASTNAMSQAIVSGEIDMGVTNSFGVIQMAETGAPMAA
jgi:ABC-type Fe3+ transport system substrate-binding protein